MPGIEIKGRSKRANYRDGGRVKVAKGGYIGKAIRSEYGGEKLSNPSYEK